MLKTLLTLSSFISSGATLINPQLISQSTSSVPRASISINTIDHLEYKISMGEIINFNLKGMLTGIKYLNDLHRESGKKVELSAVPNWFAESDDNKLIAYSFLEGTSVFALESLINSDNVIFHFVDLNLHMGSLAEIRISLGYREDNANREMVLFDFKNDNFSFPFEQKDLKVQSHYEYRRF